MPTTINFDTVFPAFLTGNMSTSVIDPDGTPNRVLEITLPFTVVVDWTLSGTSASTIGGTWDVKVILDSIVLDPPAPEVSKQVAADLGHSLAAVQAGSTPTNRIFKATLPIPAGVVPHTGVYKLITLIDYKDVANNPGQMAAFSEGPMLDFYNP
ncbi:MAG TPA: hypothetical protein VF498_15985 [Anaerolineales bacterium]